MAYADLRGQRFGMLVAEEPETRLTPAGNRMTYWRCACDCGSAKAVARASLVSGQTKSCGCLGDRLRRESSVQGRRTEDGRRLDKWGYVILRAPSHPNANSSGRILEHVLVMSEHLGRPLVKGENVHHKNGVRHDNRLENLELWLTKQPRGQKVSDRVSEAVELLRRYSPDLLVEEEER